MTVTLDWLGCATFRLQVDDTVIMLDAYIDRVPLAPDVGLTAADISRVDAILVGHSHFDHIAGAEVIAANTGAPVVGSNESARVLLEAGISEDQLLRSQGGERHRISRDITIEVFPQPALLHLDYRPPGIQARSSSDSTASPRRSAGATEAASTSVAPSASDPRTSVQTPRPR